MRRSNRPRRLDRRIQADLDLIEELVDTLKTKYPEAVEAADDVPLGTSGDGLPRRSSAPSDPTANLALDARRRRRQAHVRKAREAIGHATKTLRRAVVHACLAMEE